jgi:hypothetical protein
MMLESIVEVVRLDFLVVPEMAIRYVMKRWWLERRLHARGMPAYVACCINFGLKDGRRPTQSHWRADVKVVIYKSNGAYDIGRAPFCAHTFTCM